ncbi:hypothetical protein ACFV9G_21275 [Nocardioides sp. NPDC059952]|uniref:hypothetical protein n=1 Tax=Nocardioides sp. NPDC059952 TaxID=3347014 RepID=UPI0036658A36
MASASPDSKTGHSRPPDWVPVERRWWGLDRLTLRPALIVVAFALVAHFGVPAIDAALPNDDETSAGDRMLLKKGVSFVAAPGWNIESGIVEGDEPISGSLPRTTVLTSGEVSFTVTVGDFDGDLRGLMEQLEKTTDATNGSDGFHITSDAYGIRSADGEDGLLARYSSIDADGALAVFLHDGTGAQVTSTGPAGTDEDVVEQVAAMILSVEFGEEESA